MTVAGVDSWKRRWVAVILDEGVFDRVVVASSLPNLVRELGACAAIGIDAPIGLPTGGQPRGAEAAARRFVGPHRSRSVFPTYPRPVYDAHDYQAARIRSFRLTRRSISRQAYGLKRAIIETDAIAARHGNIFEVHPEVSFRGMAGAPLSWSKASWNGIHERIAILSANNITVPTTVAALLNAGAADTLDAAAAAWTAARIAAGQAQSLPEPPQAGVGRPMAIWY
jgi:predicted RNase H-like nuclease